MEIFLLGDNSTCVFQCTGCTIVAPLWWRGGLSRRDGRLCMQVGSGLCTTQAFLSLFDSKSTSDFTGIQPLEIRRVPSRAHTCDHGDGDEIWTRRTPGIFVESSLEPRESSRLEFETIIQQQETTRKEEEEAHSPAHDRGRELCLELLSCRECLPFRSFFSHIYRKTVAPACVRNPFEKLSLGWKQARERERRTRVTYCCIP